MYGAKLFVVLPQGSLEQYALTWDVLDISVFFHLAKAKIAAINGSLGMRVEARPHDPMDVHVFPAYLLNEGLDR